MSEEYVIVDSKKCLTTRSDISNFAHIAIQCLICEDSVELEEYEESRLKHGMYVAPKICDKCKEAILKMRNTKVSTKDKTTNQIYHNIRIRRK